MSEPPPTIRAFIAIKLPSDVRASVGRVQQELKAAVGIGPLRWTPLEQIHLTLRFLGDIATDSVPELGAALHRASSQIAPFELYAEGLGSFPDLQRPRVLWIGLGGELDVLQQFQEAIFCETEHWGERDERAFHPHLTIGRTRTTRRPELRELSTRIRSASATNLGAWRVTQLELMRSELFPDGARHSCLVTVPLGGHLPSGEAIP